MNKDEINKFLDGNDQDTNEPVKTNEENQNLNGDETAQVGDTTVSEKEMDDSTTGDMDNSNEQETTNHDYVVSEPSVLGPMSRKDTIAASKKRKKSELKELKKQEKELKKELKKVKRQERKKNKRRQIIKWTIIGLLACLIGGVAYSAISLYMKTDNAFSKAFKPRENSSNEDIDPIKDPISILVLGVDDDEDRNIGSARTDAMLFLTVSPQTNKITMTSIPRDTYTQIEAPNFSGRGKINAAYAHGGIDSTIDAVENLFADKEMNPETGLETATNPIPINYYLTVDFQAFEKIIDALGGVELEVKLPKTVIEQNAKGKKVVKLENGKQVLSGEKALAYARTRKVDNDVMRGSRQQQVLEATLAKAMSMGSISKFEKVIDALNGHVWTDMTMTTMKKVAESGLTNHYDFESYIFDWSGFDYNEESMVALHQDSLNYIGHKFRLNLGLVEKDPVMDDPDFKLKSNGIISQYTFPLDGQGIMN